ncbi:formyltransferase [Acidiferrobacter sp.]|uniref:formyltransferase n=1 Tax=Acidiferrobacter sp. TaxID=1872107 RepID=UPI00262F09F0|nr:formyltransferase [Acidiferrobacter sp.]
MTNSARAVVFAYHEVGYRCLEWLLARGVTVPAVFTHEDAPHERIWFRSVAALARAAGLPVYTPSSLRDPSLVARLSEWRPDVLYSFYYRNMIPRDILAIPRCGAFNMHGSLLPRYRGRVPVNWAIIHGERETGATLHHMVARADAGDIVDQEACPIGPEDTAREVFLKVTEAAVAVLARSHDAIVAGRAPRRAQDEGQATTFGARRPEDGRIDWGREGASIFNFVRALTEPYPGAFSTVRGQDFRVWWGRPVAAAAANRSPPGRVVSIEPLIIATGDGGFLVERFEWAAPVAAGRGNFILGEHAG